MLSKYLKTGWRNFLKYKSYSLINLFGLSIGFSSALLLFLIVRYENSFDEFHNHTSQIYRLGNRYLNGHYDDRVVVPQAPLMDEEYPDITASTRIFPQSGIINVNGKYVRLAYSYVDPGFADVFDFKMIKGDMRNALSSAGQIVLTEKKAESIFGNSDPIGKTILLQSEKKEYIVAGVAANPPGNSTLQFEALMPWNSAPKWLDIDQSGNWYNTFMEAYVTIAPNATKEGLEAKLVNFVNAHFLEDRKAEWRVLLLPMANEHFRLTGNQRTISILAIMAGSILLISCINFANLNIAQTLRRTREIGLRRVMGSLKLQIAFQFVSESVIAFGLSLLVGITIAWIALPFVNGFYGFQISISVDVIGSMLIFLSSAGLLAILISTLGTAMVLTKLEPVNAIKGMIGSARRGESLRRALLVLQFAASIVLLIGTVIVWQQTEYMKSQDLKFNGSNVVIIDTWTELFRDAEKARLSLSTLRDELMRESSITSAAFTYSAPGEYNENYNGFTDIGDSANDKSISLRKVYMADGYFETLGMSMAMGRDFSTELKSDTSAVIVNETAMRAFGWTDINNKVLMEGGEGNAAVQVIGVVKDYFYQSLKRPIQPLIHVYSPQANGRLAVRFEPGRVPDGLKILENKWHQLDAFEPFSYKFVDKTFETLYKEQERLGATASFFSAIAIIIATLGLLSITAYSIRLRRKEVGIRKVLGASVRSIVFNLSMRYSVMIGIGFSIACPIVYYLTSRFLEDFAYRISLSPFTFILAGLLVFVLSGGIIFTITSRAAKENPIHTLTENG